MAVLAPGSAHAKPSAQPPIDMSGNLLAHMSAESPSNISPNPSEVISEVSEPYCHFSKYPPFPPKNRIVRGVGGSLKVFWGWNPNILAAIAALYVTMSVGRMVGWSVGRMVCNEFQSCTEL